MVNSHTTNNNAAKSRGSNGNASRCGSNRKRQPAGNGSNAAGSTQQGRAQNDHAAFPSQARSGVNASRWNTGNKQKGKQNNWTAPQNNQHKPQQSSPPVQAMQATPQQTSTALNPASIPFELPKSGTVVELTDAELEIITKLESDNKELRKQLSKMEAELMASQKDAIASKLQKVSLLQQLGTSKIETSATSEPSASTSSADSATNARVTALESDNKTLRAQAIQNQAELSTARSTEQEAIKQELEVEPQVQTLQTELDDLKRSAAQQPSQNSKDESVSKLETEVQALNTQIAQHRVDLDAARATEQAAISRETAAVTESEGLRSQLAAAQKEARPHDTMDIAVAVQTSRLAAEKKDLQEQLISTREQLSAAYLAEQTAVASANSMVVQLETAELDIQRLREELDMATNKSSEKEKAAETSKTATSKGTSPAETTTSAATADTNALQDRISRLEKELQSSRDSLEAAEANKVPPHEDIANLQSEVERLSRQISLTTSQEAAARLAEDKAIERAATAKSDAESLRSEVVFLREFISATPHRRHTNNATSETEEMTSGQEKKATVYTRYRNPEEVAALERQVQDAQAEQKVAQDEVARLRAAADVLQVDLDNKVIATTAEASTTKPEINIEILKLRTEVDELTTKLNNTAKSSAKEGESNSDSSRTLLEGQLTFAKALLKSFENEKANSIAETIRLRKELTTYKKDFETLEAQLRKTEKQLRKYTGEVKKHKETTAGAVEETSKPKTKASHLLIQTTQLAMLKEKDKQIEDIRLAAEWAHTKLTKTIVAQNDEMRKLKKNMKLPSHASKVLVTPSTAALPKPEQWAQPLEMVTGPTQSTSSVPEPDQKAHDGETPIVYAQPAPHLLHIPRKDVTTTIDAEIAQSRQAFEAIRLRRANAFSSWQLEQAGQPHREKAWETLEKETFKEQQDLREELQVRKEALIRKARLAEDQLQTSLKLKKQQEAARIASEEKAKPVTVNWDASSSEALKESLAEARQGKQKMQRTVEETWGEARTIRGAYSPEAHKETLLGQQEAVAPTGSKEQVKPRTSASEIMRKLTLWMQQRLDFSKLINDTTRPRKNASQTAMSNQQTVDIFKLIRDSPSVIAMQEPIDTMPSDAWKSCCAYRFFFPQPQNLISPNLWISSTAPIELQDYFQPLSLDLWRVILRISPHSRRTIRLTSPNNEPSHPLIVKMQEAIPPTSPGSWRTILPISPNSQHRQELQPQLYLTPSRTTTSHFPSQDQAGQECLEMETEGCLERPRAANMGHEVAARPVESPMRLRNDVQSRQGFACRSESTSAVMRLSLDGTSPYHRVRVLAKNTSGHFPPIKSTIGGCGIPQGLLNLHRAYGSARSWTVPLLIARPAQPQTMFLDRFSLIESLIGGRGILQDLSKTFEH
ncbi:hypothetical protein D6C80_06480 [Aureobasidium pullulans]|nr:hypothetical protein D6C80_06480 [Aureobasidium pullulans]